MCLKQPDSGLERKAATQVREFEKLAFAYFALVSLTSVHRIQKMAPGTAPGISGSPSRLTTLPQALLFLRKMAPRFLEAPNLWVRCRRRFFAQKWPPSFWKPVTADYAAAGAFSFPQKRRHISGSQIWAQIMRARHGNIWRGTDPPDLGTARHGTSLAYR